MNNNNENCTCNEPHISSRICHHYNGENCHVKDDTIACNKLHSLSPLTMEDWEKEFDEQFYTRLFSPYISKIGKVYSDETESVKNFIKETISSAVSQALKEERKEIIAKIPKESKKHQS